ncbi:Glycosyl transferase, group 1 [Pseudoalteromonas luteoviolacea B = ATCC 29581]|nr:Glycosyl transferase, group 1 [Pseudoalteromonas luteoviolacea B = ATCC 29581]
MNKKVILIKSLNGGGAERILLNFANVFNERFGEDNLRIVSLLEEGELLNQALPSNIEFVYTPTSRLHKYWCLIKLVLFRKQIAKQFCQEQEDYELISFLEGWSDLIIHALPSDPHCKRISWLHCGFDLYKKWNPVHRFFLKYGTQSNVVNCVSNYVKNSIPEIENTRTVYNFIDIDYIQTKAVEEPLDDEMFLDKSKKHLVAVGRMVYQKNFEFLLRAFKAFTQHNPDAVLHLLGDGELRTSLEALTQKLGLTNSVNFVGFVDNPYKYIKNADLVCMTSHFEGLPTVVIESAILGTPVIATQCGAQELLTLFGYPDEIEFDEATYAKAIDKTLSTEYPPLERKLFEKHFSFDNFLSNMSV